MARADTLEELAERLDIDPAGFVKTIEEYNAAVQTDIPYNPTIKDGRNTIGITPPKSNWAELIDTPPYTGYAVTCGISFTFGGIKINNRGQIVTNSQEPIPGLYAAGEMVGGLFYHNYPGGSGLSAGMVFGRLSGNNAGQDAKALKG
jgi:tricarballylate dehydrogenase